MRGNAAASKQEKDDQLTHSQAAPRMATHKMMVSGVMVCFPEQFDYVDRHPACEDSQQDGHDIRRLQKLALDRIDGHQDARRLFGFRVVQIDLQRAFCDVRDSGKLTAHD